MAEMKQLDESGFVFLDGLGRPYWCRMWRDQPWLCYWHHDNHWVSLRKVSQTEIAALPRNLSLDEQAYYHNLAAQTNKKAELSTGLLEKLQELST